MTLIVNAGGLLSVFDGDQDDHELFSKSCRWLVVPSSSPRWSSPSWTTSAYQVERISGDDLARARALLARYADLTTFDLADASCVVLAERYDCFDILTTDQRDFRAVTRSRGRHFRILPYDR